MNKCPQCGSNTKSKFCSSSCSATYNNTQNHWRVKQGKINTKTCIWCKVPISGKNRKFCSNKCDNQWRWEHVTKVKVESGKCTHNSGSVLKKYLIEKHGKKCSECGQDGLWNNKVLVLQLDHIDGNSDNNQLSNLRLLCPNCHTQTDNFGSKGKGNRYKKVSKRNQYLRKYKASVV